MSVRIVGIKKPRPSNRQRGSDRDLLQLIPLLQELQANGCLAASHIAKALTDKGVFTKKGKPYSATTIRNNLLRARALGFPLIIRTKSEAAGGPKGPRDPRYT